MRRTLTLLLALSILPGVPAGAQQKTVRANAAATSAADARFAAIGQRYIDGIARYAPVYGTSLGDHRFARAWAARRRWITHCSTTHCGTNSGRSTS
jgi:hypothetical protein